MPAFGRDNPAGAWASKTQPKDQLYLCALPVSLIPVVASVKPDRLKSYVRLTQR